MNTESISMQSRTTMLHHFLNAADRYPNRTAVKDQAASVNNEEIKGLLIRIASGLRKLKVAPGDLITIELLPSAELIASLLAVQCVGAAYVPSDKKAPAERKLLILDDGKPILIISDGENFYHQEVRNVDINGLLTATYR